MFRPIKSKKGGEFQAGVWFSVLVVYFIFFILVVNSANNIDPTLQGDSNATIDESRYISISSYECTEPRYKYNPETLETTEMRNSELRSIDCEESIGTKSADDCNSISGCNWENVTTGFWFWKSTEYASCLGHINVSAYGMDTSSTFSGDVLAPHDNTGTLRTASPCNHPNVIENRSNCDLFSCSWERIDNTAAFENPTDIYATVGEVFTFRYDFGFSDSTVSFILNFIFILLPLLALSVSLYFLIPFFH